jgi:transglutaminase-like putative cysteine protease
MFYRTKILLFAIVLLPCLAYASNKGYVELQSRYTKVYIDYTVNDDFTVEKISEFEIKVLNELAAKKHRKQSFSHSTSIERFEVLEAYTIKADGRRIDVPEGNYQITVNKGNADNEAIFSDRTRVTIVFPDLEENDSIYMKVKNFQTEPMFPHNFSASRYFWSQVAYDDVKVCFDLPQNMIFQYQVRDMTERTQIKNGRKLIELRYKNEKPVKMERDNFSVWNESEEAGYALSTFMDYESIARAYGERALPKSVPTERVIKLAKEIVAGEADKKKQARLLYDWVATNISYAGNCIGVGAVVPHDTDFILDNRMGDCKDHATLLEAFYNAIGIESTQALVNSGSRYSLPEIPIVNSVNHVINYIPEWDKFVDSTDPSMPFDRLGFSLSDKPVLLVEQFISNKKTPVTRIGDNVQEVVSTMKIQPDGSVIGDIHVKMKGRPAIDMRAALRHATQEQEEQWIKQAFSSKNKVGTATMKKDDPAPLLVEFNYSLEFERPEFVLPKGAGGFYVRPLMGTPMPVYSFLGYEKEEIKDYSIACSNGHSIEHLVYEFPEGTSILAKPDDFAISENHIKYSATYELDGNTLKVVRKIDDTTPGNVCPAEFINRQRLTLMKIAENMKSQVIYRR